MANQDLFYAISSWVEDNYQGLCRPKRIVIILDDGDTVELKVPPVIQSMVRESQEEFSHSPDFRSVVWRGQTFSFSPTKAMVVELLWRAHQSGVPDMTGDYLLEEVDSTTNRLADLFKGDPAWRTLIVSGGSRGSYRLAVSDARMAARG